MQISLKPYTVIKEGLSTDECMRIPDAVFHEIKELYQGTDEGMEMIKDRLISLISEHPQVPMLKFLLGQWYDVNDIFDESNEIYKDLAAEYPDFVLGHSSYISSRLEEYDIDFVDEYFNNNFDIGHHFPNRKVFDQMEYNSFMSNVIHFLAVTARYTEAEQQLAIMRSTTGNDALADNLYSMMEGLKNEHEDDDEYEEQDDPWDIYEIEIPTLPQRPVVLLPTSVDFQFLYTEESWDIEEQTLRNSIDQQKTELIAELKSILETAIIGSEYCLQQDEWSPAALHAFLLLPYLDNETSFPDVLHILAQPEEYIDFWLEYRLDIEQFLLPYFKTFSDAKLQAAKDFLLLSPGNNHSKMVVAQSLIQFVLYTPDCRDKVVQAVKEALEYYIENKEDKYSVNEVVIDSVVDAAANLHAHELTPLIQQVYELNMTSIHQGTIDLYTDAIDDSTPVIAAGYADLFEHLTFLKKEKEEEDAYDDDDDFDNDDFDFDFDDDTVHEDTPDIKSEFQTAMEALTKKSTTPDLSSSKPAKNSPCPCGSGKKYKRCHGL